MKMTAVTGADLAQALVSGLGTGAVYALVAFGISLVYATSRTLNFAHGDVVAVGVFVSLTVVAADLPAWQGIAAGIAGAALLGVALERIVAAPGRAADPGAAAGARMLGLLIAAAVIAAAAARIWGVRTYDAEQLGVGGALGADDIWRWGDVAIPAIFVWLLAAGLAVAAALDAMLRRTAFGRAVRAIAHDPQAAALCGVDVARTATIAFALAAALGAAGAVLYTPLTFLSVGLGQLFTFKGLAAAVIGGLASARGALAGGLALGVAEQVSGLWIRAGYRDAVAFALLILVLLARPAGLLGRPVVERR